MDFPEAAGPSIAMTRFSIRRDPFTGDVEADQGSLAFKYHHMASISEYDALAAQHYGDTLIGGGVNVSIGGAVWRGDLVGTFTDYETVLSAVTSRVLVHSRIIGHDC